MDIKEIKIVLDWAKSNLDKSTGSMRTNTENYNKWVIIYNKVKTTFDTECEKWVSDNCV